MKYLHLFLLFLLPLLRFAGAITVCSSNVSSVSNELITNRRTLFSSFTQNIDKYGFYNASVGSGRNIVYGSVLCRADVRTEVCHQCIESATTEMLDSCPNSTHASTWAPLSSPFDYFCMIRISNESMFKIMAPPTQTLNPFRIFVSGSVVSSPEVFNRDTETLLQELRGRAAGGDNLLKVAAGEVNTTGFTNIYLLVQCTPDLSEDDCQSCLSRRVQFDCWNNTWCMVLLPSCNYYYWNAKFYNDTRLSELSSTPITPLPSSPPTTSRGSPPPPPQGKKRRNGSPIAVIVSVILAVAFLCACIIGYICIKKRKKNNETASLMKKDELQEIISSESLYFDFAIIRDATNNFSNEKIIGKGGFGAVYKGKLPDGREIAVKRLGENSGQGGDEFKNEVILVANLQHKNLVKLFGFSEHGKEKLLIYEFVENASLDQFLFDSTKCTSLTWEIRYNIIKGIAKGLLYLHEDSRDTIIHRDLKSGNILLDREMNPKIADFGIARQIITDDTHAVTTKIIGTNGYMAPEYMYLGKLSTKSDVFSFGVLVIEIISGQRNNSRRDGETINIVNDAWINRKQGTIKDMVDSRIDVGIEDLDLIERCMKIALLCVQHNPIVRPTMTSIVQMLTSLFMPVPEPVEPSYFREGNYDSYLASFEEGSTFSTTRSSQNHSVMRNEIPR